MMQHLNTFKPMNWLRFHSSKKLSSHSCCEACRTVADAKNTVFAKEIDGQADGQASGEAAREAVGRRAGLQQGNRRAHTGRSGVQFDEIVSFRHNESAR